MGNTVQMRGATSGYGECATNTALIVEAQLADNPTGYCAAWVFCLSALLCSMFAFPAMNELKAPLYWAPFFYE